MNYLKSKRAWSLWKTKNLLSNDEAEIPEEFPCYAYLVVGSWGYEEYFTLYLYKQDIEKMLLKMTP